MEFRARANRNTVVASTGKKQAGILPYVTLPYLPCIRRRCIREPRNIFVNSEQRQSECHNSELCDLCRDMQNVPRLMISNECPFFDGRCSRDKAPTYARRYFSHEKYEIFNVASCVNVARFAECVLLYSRLLGDIACSFFPFARGF